MNTRLIERKLAALKRELAEGDNRMRELESRRVLLKSQMLRVGGAVRVLEELLEEAAREADAQSQVTRIKP
ncbi:MAG: hypothetical protein ACU826_12390 [Gammaproteobacteria bacterium]